MWLLIFQPNVKIFDASKNRCAFVASVQMRISLKFEVLISMLECIYHANRQTTTMKMPLSSLTAFEIWSILQIEYVYKWVSVYIFKLVFSFYFLCTLLSLLRYVIEGLNINIELQYFIICYINKCNITKHWMAFVLNLEYKISFRN